MIFYDCYLAILRQSDATVQRAVLDKIHQGQPNSCLAPLRGKSPAGLS